MIVVLNIAISEQDEEVKSFDFESEEREDGYLFSNKGQPFGDGYNIEFKTYNDMNLNSVKVYAEDKIADSEEYLKEIFSRALLEKKREKEDDELSGFEHEHTVREKITEKNPYDPKLIRVDPKIFSAFQIMGKIDNKQLDLSPDFQRNFVWDSAKQSLLIESLLLRIPIPKFYLSQDKSGVYQVIDGLQRLTTIHSFMKGKFKLCKLEYLDKCNGKFFDDLDSIYRQRIEDEQLDFNIIDPQTPINVKYDIFKRINSGGEPLNKQEIRNCLSLPKTRELLRKMAGNDFFKKATNGKVKTIRMRDKELCLRFAGFYLLDNNLAPDLKYRGNMDSFLDITIGEINNLTEQILEDINESFNTAMKNAFLMFGSKSFDKSGQINKSLFLALSRVLREYKDSESKFQKSEAYANSALHNKINADEDYSDSLTRGTNDRERVKTAYDKTKELIEEILNQ